jgi:hypothetical protein
MAVDIDDAAAACIASSTNLAAAGVCGSQPFRDRCERAGYEWKKVNQR